MGTIVHHTGDIFSTRSRGIGHGVNVAGVMGHGIAVQFRNRFPDMYEAYKVICRQGKLQPGENMIWEPMPGYYIYNIASQDQPGRNARYEWLESGVDMALRHADAHALTTIALPRIGSGIGGLDERQVELLLSTVASRHVASIEMWTLPQNTH